MVQLGTLGFRRTHGQCLFGQWPEAVAAVREDALTAGYAKHPSVLARVEVDVAAIKRTIPERYESFFTGASANVDKTNPGEQAGADLLIDACRRITRLSLSASRGDNQGLRLALAAAPFDAPNQPA